MKNITGSLLFFFCCSLLKAQNTIPLQMIIDRIEAGNPVFKMYDAEIRSSKEAVNAAYNWEPTQFGTGLWMTPYNPKYWAKSSSGAPGMGSYMISVEQMLPNKKRQEAEARYREAVAAPTAERKKETLNQLVAIAKKNYYEWIILQKKKTVLKQDAALLDFMSRSAELRYKNGLGKMNVYYKLQAATGTIKNLLLEIDNSVSQKKIMLNTLMNRDPSTDFTIDTVYAIKNYEKAVIDSSVLIAGRSDLKAIQQDLQLNYLAQELELAKLKPVFGVQFVNMIGFGQSPLQYSLMGTVRIPIAKAANRAAKANIESLKWKNESLGQQKQVVLNESIGAATGMQRELVLKKDQLKLFEQTIIPALRKNFQTLQLAYEQNTEDLFALFDAWESLYKTQLEYLQQLEDLLLAQTGIEKILEIK